MIYLAHPGHQPQVLSFFGPTNWTLVPMVNADGPWMNGNAVLTNTIYATGGLTIGSTVTLNSNTAHTFLPGHVGSLFRLHQQDLTTIKPWSARGTDAQHRGGRTAPRRLPDGRSNAPTPMPG